MSSLVNSILSKDGIDRRNMLKCMAWAGTGVVWTLSGGVPSSRVFGEEAAPATSKGDFSFVQLSDSHIGFNKDPYKDVEGTLKIAISKINALPDAPAFALHTGDLTHLAKPEEFDLLDTNLKTLKAERTFYVPGEHDVFTDNAKSYLERYGKNTKGLGWQSFDFKGVHFVGLVNVMNLKPGGLGALGTEQLEWLKKDLEGLAASTPIIIFAHVPLWTVYQKWGWGTEDSAQALALLRRFGSVTVLNGHIHQVMQKVEGNITFHSTCSTAFPQPAPGTAPSPGPIKNLASEKLKFMLGLKTVAYVEKESSLAFVDSNLDV